MVYWFNILWYTGTIYCGILVEYTVVYWFSILVEYTVIYWFNILWYTGSIYWFNILWYTGSIQCRWEESTCTPICLDVMEREYIMMDAVS